MILGLTLALSLVFQEPGAPEKKREDFVRIEVTLTALSGSSVYLDQGRDAGLVPGDPVRIFPPFGAPRRGKLSTVSRTSARAELDSGIEGLDVGVQGEVWIPRRRVELIEQKKAEAMQPRQPDLADEAELEAAPEPEPKREKTVPDHPPWSAPPDEWNQQQPLLAPAHGVPPEERPRRLRGRVYTTGDWTKDSSGSDERQTWSGTLGVDGRIENPFGQGGRFTFDMEAFGRRFERTGQPDEDDSKVRIDRLSYAWGGVRGARNRGEVGRFLQSELPALGFLDGVEYVRQIGTTHRVGGSLGYLPIPDDLFKTGDDLQAALFYRRADDDNRTFSYGAGYQKTWHNGEADRDLLVAEIELHPGNRTSIVSSALIDWYGSGDTLKTKGLELTQLFVNATHSTQSGHGAGLFLSQFRWPDLLRNEFPDVTAQEIADNTTTRYGADGWLALGSHMQVYGRAESWSDQDDSGGGGRARITWRDVLARGNTFLVESYLNSSKFTDAIGLRASVRQRFSAGSFDLSWDATQFQQAGVDEDLLQHTVRAGFDVSVGSNWFLALYSEARFGDDQDALSVGFLLQRSLGN